MNDTARNGFLVVGVLLFLVVAVAGLRGLRGMVLPQTAPEQPAVAEAPTEAPEGTYRAPEAPAEAPPETALPLLLGLGGGALLVGGVGAVLWRRRQEAEVHKTSAQAPTQPEVEPLGADLRAMRAQDPALSLSPLQEFISRLHRAAHEAAIGQRRWFEVGAFVHGDARRALEAQEAGVEAQASALTRHLELNLGTEGAEHRLDVRIQAVRRQRHVDGGWSWVSTRSHWVFRRNETAASLPSTSMRTLCCPSCSKPWSTDALGICRWCGQSGSSMARPWYLAEVLEHHREPLVLDVRDPSLEGKSAAAPVLRDPELELSIERLRADLPELDRSALEQFTQRLMRRVLEGNERWMASRAYCTDAAWESLRAEHEPLLAQGLARVRGALRPLGAELAHVHRDRVAAYATLRVWWKMTEAIVDEGEVVAGNPEQMLSTSEYWTLQRTGPSASPGNLEACSACGAGLQAIDERARCSACGAQLAEGGHSWVLVRRDPVWAYHRPARVA